MVIVPAFFQKKKDVKKLTKTLPKISRFQKLPSCEALYRHFNSVEKILLFFGFQVLLCFKIGVKHRKLNYV